MASIDLCTLADVRLAMETKTADTQLDLEIAPLITAASRAIMDVTQREFAPPTGSATRRLDVTLLPRRPRPRTTSATRRSMHPRPRRAAAVDARRAHRLRAAADRRRQGRPLHRASASASSCRCRRRRCFAFGHADLVDQRRVGLRGGARAGQGRVRRRSPVVAAARPLHVRADRRRRRAAPQAYGTYKLPPASLSKLDPYRRYAAGSS
jgi:hypothetical protein